MNSLYLNLFIYLTIVFSAVFHEYAHGWMAHDLGDDTAKRLGRLTLNPLAHLDLLGTVIVPLLSLFTYGAFIGWAKPVPFNPYALSDQRRGEMKVALAGPAANLIIALFFGLAVRFMAGTSGAGLLFGLFLFIARVNLFLALFNLIPFPPLDGSKILTGIFSQSRRLKYFFEGGGIWWGLFLALIVAGAILPPLVDWLLWLIIGPAAG